MLETEENKMIVTEHSFLLLTLHTSDALLNRIEADLYWIRECFYYHCQMMIHSSVYTAKIIVKWRPEREHVMK
jgi:hypothetical protein